MTERPSLPVLGQPGRERSDAARNRRRLLDAARELVRRCGVEGVTMDALAETACVGKGTVFRRFGSRAGLMAALVDAFEQEWQGRVLRGPPALGPGAPPRERLIAFGRSRLELGLTHAALLREAGRASTRSYAAWSFTAMHVRHLLTELGVAGDVPLLATQLLAPLEVDILHQQTELEGFEPERILAGWVDLVDRVVGRVVDPIDER